MLTCDDYNCNKGACITTNGFIQCVCPDNSTGDLCQFNASNSKDIVTKNTNFLNSQITNLIDSGQTSHSSKDMQAFIDSTLFTAKIDPKAAEQIGVAIDNLFGIFICLKARNVHFKKSHSNGF